MLRIKLGMLPRWVKHDHGWAEAAEAVSTDDLERDVDTVIAACGVSLRAAIRALLIANEFLSAELERATERQSSGYVRGQGWIAR
jgi:hypothetical protein